MTAADEHRHRKNTTKPLKRLFMSSRMWQVTVDKELELMSLMVSMQNTV